LSTENPARNRRARGAPATRRGEARGNAGRERATVAELEATCAAIEALPIGVVFTEYPPGGPAAIVGHNDAFKRIVGVAPRSATPLDALPVGLYLPDRMTAVPPDEWPAAIAARTGNLVRERELHLRRQSGEWRVLLAGAAPLRRDPLDPMGRAAGVMLDVTELRRAEEDLSRRGQLLRLVIETSPDPVFVKNRASQYLFANAAWQRAVGKPGGQVIGRTDKDLLAGSGAETAIGESDRRVMESGRAEAVEETVPSPDGARTLLTSKTPLLGPSGQVIGMVGIARDITDRKLAEEALQRSERRFRALIENSSDMILVVDGDGLIRFWSPSAVEALGWGEPEILGTRAIDLVHADDRPGTARAFRDALSARGGTIRHRARMRHRDGGYRIVDGLSRDLRDEAAIGAVVLNVRDVTEQARNEEVLLRSQKLEGIGRVAGGIVHDFNDLLTAILCSAESEREALDAGLAVSREDIEQIREAAARAREVVKPLLVFARRQARVLETLDLNALLAGSLEGLGRELGERVQVQTSLPGDLWPVRCDRSQLEQVVANLAANAREAMPDGGTLAFATSNVTAGPGHPDLPAGDWVRLRVTDSGRGMSREVKDHLFEPFFTTKAGGPRAGLGLSTVYGIIRQAGGQVRVESDPGAGTTFEVLLPPALAAAPAAV
jgi:two-component system cell cycle sensor histidine kinase/response regulator CckA